MIEYSNDIIVKEVKQYNMFKKTLKLIQDIDQKQAICYQMTRIIERVLKSTNIIYEKKYKKISEKQTYLMNEEKTKLLELINLINERRTFINNQISNNQELTGMIADSPIVMGEDKIEEYKEEVKIIDRYKNNINLDGILKDEITKLNISIKKAKNKIASNKNINRQLEEKMIRILRKTFDKLSLYELREREKEIELAYTELGYSLEKAKENAKIARRDCTTEIISECDNMLASITLEYERYKEKKLILHLMEIYDKKVSTYEELLEKREEINNILSGIVSSDLYLEIGEELNKEYATIKLEQQDTQTLKSLEEEKENKEKKLEEIKIENNSEEFKNMLANLLENEKKYQEKLLLERKKEEEKRRIRALEEERLKQKEFLKRQKVLEEERKKEIEERTKQLLFEKKNPILFSSKDNKDKKLEEEVKENKIKTEPKSNNIFDRKNNEPAKKISVRPSDDIFSRAPRKPKEEESIPVIKNNQLKNEFTFEQRKTPKEREEIFPKTQLKKEKDIFPAFPSLNKNDSFFDEDEFKDLNNYLEDDNKKSWF